MYKTDFSLYVSTTCRQVGLVYLQVQVRVQCISTESRLPVPVQSTNQIKQNRNGFGMI